MDSADNINATRSVYGVKRRFWVERAVPLPFWKSAILPLLGLLLLFLIGAAKMAPDVIEPQVASGISARLHGQGHAWARVVADGQHMVLRGVAPDPGAAAEALALAQSTSCDTWAGQLTCPVQVLAQTTIARTIIQPKTSGSVVDSIVEDQPLMASAVADKTTIERCEKEFQEVLDLSTIEFATGKAEIRSRSRRVISTLAEVASRCPGRLRIEGHTDNVGKETANQLLSQQRAEAVVMALQNSGIEANRLSALGFGPKRPKASNRSVAGRARNRRIEMHMDVVDSNVSDAEAL